MRFAYVYKLRITLNSTVTQDDTPKWRLQWMMPIHQRRSHDKMPVAEFKRNCPTYIKFWIAFSMDVLRSEWLSINWCHQFRPPTYRCYALRHIKNFQMHMLECEIIASQLLTTRLKAHRTRNLYDIFLPNQYSLPTWTISTELKIGVFSDFTPCDSCKNWRFGGT
jgi:hypothetical protein